MGLTQQAREQLEEALGRGGQRATRQRAHVWDVLLARRDHPTADEVFVRAKASMPNISLATVYNCLDTLVEAGLVKAVNYEREPTRYCPNLSEHAHFRDRESGRVFDIDLPSELMAKLSAVLPEGYEAESIELYYNGRAKTSVSKTRP